MDMGGIFEMVEEMREEIRKQALQSTMQAAQIAMQAAEIAALRSQVTTMEKAHKAMEKGQEVQAVKVAEVAETYKQALDRVAACPASLSSPPPPPPLPQATAHELCCLTIQADGLPKQVPGEDYCKAVEKSISGFLGLAKGQISVVDARPLRPMVGAKNKAPKVLFQVASTGNVALINSCRAKLRGKPVSLNEELTKQEVSVKRGLMKAFYEAREAGSRVSFRRARLFVNGKEIKGGKEVQ
jgi:hypothetical protein